LHLLDPSASFRANNISYAIDGIISMARNLGIDYGVYWSAGAAAMRMEIVPKATGFAIGVGISVTEKSRSEISLSGTAK